MYQNPSSSPGPETDPDHPRIPSRIYWACYILLGILLAGVVVQRYLQPLLVAEPIGVQSSQSASAEKPTGLLASPEAFSQRVENRIDPNVADWPELTRLPQIGEKIAKRIVAYRLEHATPAHMGDSSDTSIFGCPADLEAVRGIGPKTVEKIAPFLKFPHSEAANRD